MHILMVLIFAIGYMAITLENKIKVNKAAIALLVAVFCWAFNFIEHFPADEASLHRLIEHLGEISQVIFFLMGAMTIVELIDSHGGFKIITGFIRTRDKRKLLWAISIITFFLSSVLDNLTTSIVMVSLLRRLISDKNDRMIFASMVIIAANAGGAWSPIGDVTTMMLWIGGQVTTGKLMELLFIPSLVSLFIPLLYLSFSIKQGAYPDSSHGTDSPAQHGAKRVFFLGIGSLIFVPVFRAVTNLPPFMGVLLGLGIMWVLTDLIHHQKRDHLRVPSILTRVDFSSVLFFLGILLAVAALETAGILGSLALRMDNYFNNKDIIATVLGLLSSIIDNVPLTAATMGMYPLSSYPADSKLWEMIAYSVGTGGSILIIGSAAGVVVMGMEKISFGWYLKKISLPVLIGYFLGIGSFLMIHHVIYG
ncbi:MAG: sodium:proton antiporter NhaD [Candidatus Omnitrophica bacterium]|nr:sodium:proton antiporter NhaD [Candidatus Omnitrophota bacterium]